MLVLFLTEAQTLWHSLALGPGGPKRAGTTWSWPSSQGRWCLGFVFDAWHWVPGPCSFRVHFTSDVAATCCNQHQTDFTSMHKCFELIRMISLLLLVELNAPSSNVLSLNQEWYEVWCHCPQTNAAKQQWQEQCRPDSLMQIITVMPMLPHEGWLTLVDHGCRSVGQGKAWSQISQRKCWRSWATSCHQTTAMHLGSSSLLHGHHSRFQFWWVMGLLICTNNI